MGLMFAGAESFNSDISRWDVSSVKVMSNTFWKAKAVSTIQLSESKCVCTLYTKRSLFHCTPPQFNGDLSRWKVGKVENFDNLFLDATVFNTDLSSWDVSNAKTLNFMFFNANAFNQDLCGWRDKFPYIPKATYNLMFQGTSCINQGDPLADTRSPFCFDCFF